jgi:hypothetical protein
VATSKAEPPLHVARESAQGGGGDEELAVRVSTMVGDKGSALADLSRYDGVQLPAETTCPLCRHMRESPCGRHWVRWEKCVEHHKRAGEDYVRPCYTLTMMVAICINDHPEAFPLEMRADLAGSGDDDDEDSEQVAEAQ